MTLKEFIKEGEKAEHNKDALTAYYNYNGETSTLEDFEDAYSGEFSSDEDFAQDMAENVGSIPSARAAAWPFYCIDWEWAARDLMQDYYEEDGFYFRA